MGSCVNDTAEADKVEGREPTWGDVEVLQERGKDLNLGWGGKSEEVKSM